MALRSVFGAVLPAYTQTLRNRNAKNEVGRKKNAAGRATAFVLGSAKETLDKRHKETQHKRHKETLHKRHKETLHKRHKETLHKRHKETLHKRHKETLHKRHSERSEEPAFAGFGRKAGPLSPGLLRMTGPRRVSRGPYSLEELT
jgi:hypothetical protein